MVGSSSVVKRANDVLAANVDDELVMMRLESNGYFGLDAIGRRIWELLDEPRTVGEICSTLLDEYDVQPAACEADVLRFLNELESMASSPSKIRTQPWGKLRRCTWRERLRGGSYGMADAIRRRDPHGSIQASDFLARLDPTSSRGGECGCSGRKRRHRLGSASRCVHARPGLAPVSIQALAATQMLRRRGIAGTLTLGVMAFPDENERIKAHAWLQQGAVFLTGEEGHQCYTPISSYVSK